jgi:hypothetical protein
MQPLHHGLELQSRGKRKPRHVIGAGFSEAQPKFMTFCQAGEERAPVAVGSGTALLLIFGWLDCWDC